MFRREALAARPSPRRRTPWSATGGRIPRPRTAWRSISCGRNPRRAIRRSSFANLKSLLTPTPDVTVNGTGTIRVDFGRENAGWFEIDSPDCPGGIQMSISEYNEPEYTNIGDKTITPERIGNTYRAKFNTGVL